MSAPKGASHQIDFSIAAPRLGVPQRASFEAWALAALDAALARSVKAKPFNYHLAIRIVDLVEAVELNTRFRQKDYAPNVLSFAAGDYSIERRLMLGDIAICRDVVLAEALAQGKSSRAHFAHMTIHGVLHLLGLDHENESEAALMEAQESAILASLGFASPY